MSIFPRSGELEYTVGLSVIGDPKLEYYSLEMNYDYLMDESVRKKFIFMFKLLD